MRLVKIFRDKVQIRSDEDELKDVRVNDLLTVGDGTDTLAVMVTGITDNTISEPLPIAEDDFIGQELECGFISEKLIDCTIIGSIIDGKYSKAIRQYPTTDITVKKATAEDLKNYLNEAGNSCFALGKYGETGTAAFVDGNKFFQRHASIVGNTGSGKSETVAKILESISELPNGNVIIFDIHGEYGNISYVDHMKVGDTFDFPIWCFGLTSIMQNILKIKEESATVVSSAIRKVFHQMCNDASEDKPVQFDIHEMYGRLVALNEEEVPTGEVYKTGSKAGMPKMTKGDLNGKLTSAINSIKNMMDDKRYQFLFMESGITLEEIVMQLFGNPYENLDIYYPIRCIDFSAVPHDLVIPMIGAITNLVYGLKRSIPNAEEHPLTLICDEAHVYIPTNFNLSAAERRTVQIFEKIAKEGRKFGCTLLVASQRPSELNKTIMAQCANFIVMKLNNEADKAMIKGMLPDGSESVIDSTTTFAPGDCFVIGDASQMPLKIKVDLAKERPQSRTIDYWEVWGKTGVSGIDMENCLREYMK